jgi:hypothetical protein
MKPMPLTQHGLSIPGGGDRQISEQAADLQHCGAEEGP